jgi:peptidoglycan/xylan/chitin deacetylase (PgdA/CDA1 family)
MSSRRIRGSGRAVTFAALGSVATALGRAGADRAVLMYHGHGPSWWDVSAPRFEEQARWLRSRFELVPLRELADTLPPAATLTFDDGALDNAEITLPILERLEVHATFFIVAGLIGGRLEGGRRCMSAAQIDELASLGHEIGSHTTSHAVLTSCSPSEAAREVAESRRSLEDLLGREVTSFAYPKGAHDEAAVAAVREAGYRLAVTTREGHVRADTDPLRIPRINVDRGVTRGALRGKLSAGLSVYERMRGRR